MLDKNFEQILQSIESGVPVIIRELFSSEEVTHLRKNCNEWAQSEEPNHPKDRSFGYFPLNTIQNINNISIIWIH